ncbi:YfhO family protein [Bacillus velezensis]|nr:YfhO family protein [Bacillus velezensis]
MLGAEKNHPGKKPAWFIFACALTLINNFYFAYINLIFIGIYILFRWVIPLKAMRRKSSLNAGYLFCRAFSGSA